MYRLDKNNNGFTYPRCNEKAKFIEEYIVSQVSILTKLFPTGSNKLDDVLGTQSWSSIAVHLQLVLPQKLPSHPSPSNKRITKF